MTSTDNKITAGPLAGTKVLDWTMWQFGPVCSLMLGDLGADVIKIESPEGDAGRALWRASNIATDIGQGRNAYFEACNRNKRGLAVNMKTSEGKDIVYDLVKKSDVFVQNFRQGVADRLGMGYATLHEINPLLIYGSGNGYGPRGPDSHLPSFDGCGQARSGLMMSASDPDADYPNRVSQGVSDQIGGIMLCQGILAALVARNIQGVGQHVQTSHLSANMWLQGMGMTMSLLTEGEEFAPYNRENPPNPLSNLYKCKDGKFIQLQHLQPDRYWKPLMKLLDLECLIDDERFQGIRKLSENSRQLVKILDAAFANCTADEWDIAFREAPIDFIYAKVQKVEDLRNDPQVIANSYITEFEHPALGVTRMCNHPNIYSETPSGIWREAPELGQHTEEILIDDLGCSWDDISHLRDAGAII